MKPRESPIINENFFADEILAGDLDSLLSEGWRHFGCYFFRYNVAVYEGKLRMVIPLRIRLDDFLLSRSQRRISKRNLDLQMLLRPTVIDEEKEALFRRHRDRFRRDAPGSILHFIDIDAATRPCEGMEICLYNDEGRLVAASFMDIGDESVSGVYAMFDPEFSRRSLGIYTLLLEVDYAIRTGRKFYYQGYAYRGKSFYDYKKRFSGLEEYDWQRDWKEFVGP